MRALALLLLTLLPLAALASPAPESGEPVSGTVPVVELVREKARDSFGAELPAEGEFSVTVQNSALEEAVMFSAFWMDKATGQFLANAVTAEGRVTRLQGLAILTVELPVPARRLLPGELIGEGDLQRVTLPYARVSGFAVTEEAELLGKEVRRILAQGRPVMVQSVMEPLVIDRGDKVSIHYDDGKLALTAPGRALDDAHRGQEVRIVNLVSNQLVRGVAKGEGLVEIIR